jgi:hypothetical protein
MSQSGTSHKRVVYTLEEQVILRELVKNYISVVENKSTNKVGLKKKEEAWDQITIEFNQQPNVSARDSKSLRKYWDNLKTRTKVEVSNEQIISVFDLYVTVLCAD